MRKRSNGGSKVRGSILLVMWASGISIHSKHSLNSTENMKTNPKPLSFVMCLYQCGRLGVVEAGRHWSLGILFEGVDNSDMFGVGIFDA